MWEIGAAYNDKLPDKTCGGRPFLVFGLVIITNDLVRSQRRGARGDA